MRTSRLHLLAAAGVTVATFALTACQDSTGTRDEGASASQPAASTGTSSQSPAGSSSEGSGTDGNGGSANEASANGGSAAGADTSGKGDSGGGKSGQGTKEEKGSGDATATYTSCNGSNTAVSAQPVPRPVNHMLITVENTGSKNCNLTYHPVLRFDEMQWVPQPIEESKPQAVVTLAPGESAYAGVLLSAADGSGSGGATGKKLTVGFQGRTPNSSGGPSALPGLPPKGVYYDSSLTVTYWQYSMDDALAY
ncbi:DUF4232 domain-containing protein [Streptomyces sp. NPDC096538]|uniref:DUF4232 domain-containing protein n=1 Tax=Streptomyces sp. NPDC096538 TaxID=3155427 RepID=UPI003318A9BA